MPPRVGGEEEDNHCEEVRRRRRFLLPNGNWRGKNHHELVVV